MTFLSTLFLWGLGLMSVPVIIHLLNRRRKEVIHWGAMQFLLEAAPRRWRMRGLSDLLLMLLRALLVALFVLALARPLLKGVAPGGAPRDVILVLDTSLSTSQTVGSQRLFDLVLQEANRLIGELRQGDMVRVLLADAGPEWLTPVAIPVNANVKREICARLEKLTPSLGAADMLRCAQEAVAAEPANEQASRLVVLLTDGQSYGWRTASPGAWRDVHNKVRQMPIPAELRVVLVDRGTQAVKNVSAESLTASRALAAAGDDVVLTAEMKNTGQRAMPASLVTWRQDGQSLGVTSMPALDPQQATTVSMKCSFDSPGVYELTCTVDQTDDLTADNTARFVVEVTDQAAILVLDGAETADILRSQTAYILACLGSADSSGQWDQASVFRAKVVRAAALASQTFADFRCIVLADPPPLPEAVTARLAEYVRAGGGLWIALGQRTDPDAFNRTFYGQGLSPLPLGRPVGDADDRERFEVIHPPTTRHPATLLLGDTKRLDLDRAGIYRRHLFADTQSYKNVSVLLRAGAGSPLVVEKSLGKGRIIVQAVPLGARWTSLPTCQAFVVMVHEWLWYLVEPTVPQWNLNPGDALTVSFPAGTWRAQAKVDTPRGAPIELTGLRQNGRTVYSFTKALWAGPYRLILKTDDGATGTMPFHVRRDVAESDLTSLSPPQIQALAATGGLQFVSNPLSPAAGEQAQALQPIWTWLLVALLVVMLMEMLLACRLTRRRLGRTIAPAAHGPEMQTG